MELLTEYDNKIINMLCGNKIIYGEILIWLKTFNYNLKISKDSCIIVTGKTCIGKTYSINKICSMINYEIINISNNNCYNSAELNDIIFKSTTSSLVQQLTNNIRKKVIIIDNFDCIYMADKTINATLLKILVDNKIKNIPIICLANEEIIKKIGDIKKVCKIYNLSIPTKEDIYSYFSNLSISSSNIKKISKKNIDNLYEISKGNLNKLFSNIDKNKEEPIYDDEVDDDIDVNILYLNNFNRNKVVRIINKEQWVVPLKFHENIIIELNNRNISLKNKIEYYKQFIDIMCLYDYYMYKNNNEVCVSIFAYCIYQLSLFKYKKGASPNLGKFTKILTYLSLQKKNIKQNYKYNKFPLYQIQNYHINLCNRKFISFN
jgi:hypothetical protein